MGRTWKALKAEIYNALSTTLSSLKENEKKLTKEEKAELREYLETIEKDSKIHTYTHIFIARKIKEIINRRKYTPEQTENIFKEE